MKFYKMTDVAERGKKYGVCSILNLDMQELVHIAYKIGCCLQGDIDMCFNFQVLVHLSITGLTEFAQEDFARNYLNWVWQEGIQFLGHPDDLLGPEEVVQAREAFIAPSEDIDRLAGKVDEDLSKFHSRSR